MPFTLALLIQITLESGRVASVLCSTEAQAIELASSSLTNTQAIAQNLVNRKYGGEVCGRYIGTGGVEAQKTVFEQGAAYMVSSFRFDDGSTAWSASVVKPFDGNSLDGRVLPAD